MDKNRKPKESNDETTKTHEQHLLSCVVKLSKALGQEIPTDRQISYVEALSDLSRNQIDFGFELALKRFVPEFGKKFPYPAEIRVWCEEWRPVDPIAETRKYLNREDKPTDWTGMGRKAGVTPEEIQRWLEDSQEKERERIAIMKADPGWQAMAARLGGLPGLTGARPAESTVPVETGARASWARAKAVENGWAVGREPGEEG